MDSGLLKRYISALGMITLMVGIAELSREKEIIFPEMAALTIGMWIVGKRVWVVGKKQMVCLMTVGAVAGTLIASYSPLPLLINLMAAFSFAAACLLISGTTLIPLISACMLPVLLKTETWIYPAAVFCMSLLVAGGQKLMEKYGLRQPLPPVVTETQRKQDLIRWLKIAASIAVISALALSTSNPYFILPPLIVTYVEFVNSKAGFRNRPVQTWLILVSASAIGTGFQWLGCYYFQLPQTVVVIGICFCVFMIFVQTGKVFAPAGALALIPAILPEEGLLWLPLQAATGAALFITIAMVGFQQCYKWSKARLMVCFIPFSFRRNNRQRR